MTVLVRSVKYVQLLSGYCTLKAFQLWLSDLLQYQNHENSPLDHVTQTVVNGTAKFVDGYTGYLEIVYQLLSSYVTAPDRQCKYNVILRGVRVTVSVFVKQYILHIVTVWVNL